MALGVNAQKTLDIFMKDLVATFQLTSPTIFYDSDEEAPEICYTSQWLLCLSTAQTEGSPKELENEQGSSRDPENDGMLKYYNDDKYVLHKSRNSTFLNGCDSSLCFSRYTVEAYCKTLSQQKTGWSDIYCDKE